LPDVVFDEESVYVGRKAKSLAIAPEGACEAAVGLNE
jgi:hypothetical protein